MTTEPAATGTVVDPVRVGTLDALVPRPVVVGPGSGSFALVAETVVVAPAGRVPAAADAVALLRERIGRASGLELPTRDAPGDAPAITFTEPPADAEWAAEAYELAITPSAVRITAGDHDGYVWAVQTLVQALPPEAFGAEPVEGTFALPAGTVTDRPRFAWRGAMLDVVRHFFPVEDVQAFVDQVSAHKLNRLHLHLSDDQGWRIEIRSHPSLARVGGANEVGGGPGGHYTQDEYRGLVAYAAARGVTVVPEIDVPGHTNAALHALPELTCDGVAPEPYTGTQVGFSSVCTTSEATYAWFDDVVGELAELTPGRWLHLGGDESHATEPGEYRRFVRRAAAIVVDHGKTPVGWEEIGTAPLPPGSVVQHWLDPAPTLAGIAQGASVVLSPAPRAYLDMGYVAGGPGNDWAGMVPTRAAYEWDPATLLDGVATDRILGVEAPLWTELVADLETVQQRTLPRLPAIAEVGWSPQEDRAWDDFAARVAAHGPRWDELGWAWTRDADITWTN